MQATGSIETPNSPGSSAPKLLLKRAWFMTKPMLQIEIPTKPNKRTRLAAKRNMAFMVKDQEKNWWKKTRFIPRGNREVNLLRWLLTGKLAESGQICLSPLLAVWSFYPNNSWNQHDYCWQRNLEIRDLPTTEIQNISNSFRTWFLSVMSVTVDFSTIH